MFGSTQADGGHCTDEELQRISKEEYDEFFEVLPLTCLERGCMHKHIEHFCGTGVVSQDAIYDDPCGDMCPICTGEFEEALGDFQIPDFGIFSARWTQLTLR